MESLEEPGYALLDLTKRAIMTDEPSPKAAARKQREDRLAAEMRENLKKRKAQMRARKNTGSKPTPADR